MHISVRVKWCLVLITLVATLAIPLVFFENQSNSAFQHWIESAKNQPVLAAITLILALTADVFLPVPNGAINTMSGYLFGWAVGSFVIWSGLTLGCIAGYWAGRFAGLAIVKKFIGENDLQAAQIKAETVGDIALILTRTVPMIAEVTTMAAGITRYPFFRFLLITSLANLGVAIVFAGIGNAAIEKNSSLYAIFGSVLLPVTAWLIYRSIRRHRTK